jgi:hypothetical protein
MYPDHTQHLIVEINKVIANANFGMIDDESASPLRILLISPFLMTDIKGEMTKQNQQ